MAPWTVKTCALLDMRVGLQPVWTDAPLSPEGVVNTVSFEIA